MLLLSFGYYSIAWLVVTVCAVALITAIVRYGNFRKEEDRQLKEGLKKSYDMALEHQRDVAKEYGINSKEVLAAKEMSMEIFKQMVAMDIT